MNKELRLWVNLKLHQYLKQEKMRSEEQNKRKGLSGGVKSGPPPKRGPNPQGITVKHAKKVLRKSKRNK